MGRLGSERYLLAKSKNDFVATKTAVKYPDGHQSYQILFLHRWLENAPTVPWMVRVRKRSCFRFLHPLLLPQMWPQNISMAAITTQRPVLSLQRWQWNGCINSWVQSQLRLTREPECDYNTHCRDVEWTSLKFFRSLQKTHANILILATGLEHMLCENICWLSLRTDSPNGERLKH